jgi:hypothetical protein
LSNYVFHKLKDPINIKGKCSIKIHHHISHSHNTLYCNIIDYYWFLYEGNNYSNIGGDPSVLLLYEDIVYYIEYIDIHINGKYILDYTFSELSTIVDSENYIIGPNPILPDEAVPQKFTLDDYYCNATDGKIFISTTLKDHYPCKNGVLELVIKHHKPSSIIISKNDTNLTKLIKHLVKYDVAITIV